MINSITLCIIYSSGFLNWEEQRGLMFRGALVCIVEYQWIPHTKPVSLLSPEHTITQSHWYFCRRLCSNEELDTEKWTALNMRGRPCVCVIKVVLTSCVLKSLNRPHVSVTASIHKSFIGSIALFQIHPNKSARPKQELFQKAGSISYFILPNLTLYN